MNWEGMVSDAVWRGWENTFRAYLNAPGFAWYLQRRRSFFTPEFHAWVESLEQTAKVADPRAAAITPPDGSGQPSPHTKPPRSD